MRWHICVILIVVIQHCEGGIVKENVQTLGSTTNRATGSTPAASSVITATTKGNVFTPSVINRIQVPSLSKQTDFIFPKV